MSRTSEFDTWLRGQTKQRNCIGDLARLYAEDWRTPIAEGPGDLHEWLSGTTGFVWYALQRTAEAWEKHQRTQRERERLASPWKTPLVDLGEIDWHGRELTARSEES